MEEEGLPFCKICLEIDIKNNLISPCLCTSHVHKACLDKWRMRFDITHANRIKCTDCKGKYDYDIKEEKSCYHFFIIYCYIIGFASLVESAGCEFQINMISNDGNNLCYFLLLPNNILSLINLCISVCLINNGTLSKKVSMVFAMVFNTLFFLLIVFIVGPASYVTQPIVIFLKCMMAIKNIRKYIVMNKLEGWQLLDDEE